MMWQQNPELVKIAVGRGYNPILPCGDAGLLFPSDSPSRPVGRNIKTTSRTTKAITSCHFPPNTAAP